MVNRLLGILTVALAITSCDNTGNNIGSIIDNSGLGIVGSWYTEDNALEMFAERTFTTTGDVYVDEYRKMYGYKRVEEYGKYSFEGQTLTTNLQSSVGTTMRYSYNVTNYTDLSFETSSTDYGKATYYRIVGSITVQKGEEQEMDVLQFVQAYTNKDIAILSAEIDDEAIALFENGKVVGRLIGQTYIKVDTSIGRVIIKLSVEDKDNLLNDYSIVLGKQIDEVEKILGKHYAYKNDSVVHYICDDYYINTVDTYRHYNNSVVDSVVIEFNDNVSSKTIAEELQKKLIQVENYPEHHVWFTDERNFLLSKYSARYYYYNNKLVYTRIDPDWDDRTNDLGLSVNDLRKKYGRPRVYQGNTVKYEWYEDFITEIYFHINDNGTVGMYRIYINFQTISPEMIDNYLEYKFKQLDVNHPHAKNCVINGKEKILYVTYNKNEYYFFYQILDNRF